MERIFLPTLHWFAMKNPFTGSCGEFRFRAEPNVIMATAKEVDFDASTIKCEYWHGPFCYEKSTIAGKNTFSMSEAGRNDLIQWLQSLA